MVYNLEAVIAENDIFPDVEWCVFKPSPADITKHTSLKADFVNLSSL